MLIRFETPWQHKFFLDRTPNSKGVVGEFEFAIDKLPTMVDAWVVWGDLTDGKNSESVKVKEGCLIFITDEAHDQKYFHPEFLAQFDIVLTLRDDIHHPGKVRFHELNTWLMPLTYDEAVNLPALQKTKKMSIVASSLNLLPGHKKRLEFVRYLMKEFDGRIDFYGRDINPIENKLDALLPYQYSIAIENNALPGYFTEKLTECFLTRTLPIYYGCTDIENYFPSESMIKIDLDDFEASARVIDRVLQEDPYEIRLGAIDEARKLYLNQYHIFNALAIFLDTLPTLKKDQYRRYSLRSNSSFISGGIFQRLKRRLF